MCIALDCFDENNVLNIWFLACQQIRHVYFNNYLMGLHSLWVLYMGFTWIPSPLLKRRKCAKWPCPIRQKTTNDVSYPQRINDKDVASEILQLGLGPWNGSEDAKLLRFCVLGSSYVYVSFSGIVTKLSVCTIPVLMPVLNCCTCLLMYNKNASLFHLLCNIMV